MRKPSEPLVNSSHIFKGSSDACEFVVLRGMPSSAGLYTQFIRPFYVQ
jgi:hypothetical protein